MNALFCAAIKVFLALLQTQDAVGQDHGDGAHLRNWFCASGKSLVLSDSERFCTGGEILNVLHGYQNVWLTQQNHIDHGLVMHPKVS